MNDELIEVGSWKLEVGIWRRCAPGVSIKLIYSIESIPYRLSTAD